MLIHSKEIIKKWLLHTNTIPKNLFATNGKTNNQFLSYVQNIKNDKGNYTIPSNREYILIKNMDMLQQLIQNSKKDSKILTTHQREISIFIQYLSRCIAEMNYEELVKTMKMLTKISRFYHQFKRQFLFYFFKSLQRKMKDIIIYNQPPLSLKEISSIIHPFLKAKSTTNVSREILEFIVTKKLKITGEKPFTKQMLHIFIPYGVKTTNHMKLEIFGFLQAQNQQNLIPLIGEVVLLYLEYNISLSQFPSWVINYFRKFYVSIQPNNIYDHVLSLYILVKFSKQSIAALDLNLNNLSLIDNVIILNKKIMYLLDNLLSLDRPFQSYLNCLDLFQKLYVKHIYHINLLNKQIKAMNRKQDIICVLTINLKIIQLANYFEKNTKMSYEQIRECLFPFMKIIYYQFDKLMLIQKVPSMVFDLIMFFIQLSHKRSKQLINYLRPIQFLVILQPYLSQKQHRKYVDFLKIIKQEANQGKIINLQTFQLIRLRLVLIHMKISLDPHCRLETVYKNAKKNQLQTIFENLDRTKLRELNLPEMIQICKDLMKGKNDQSNYEEGLSWSILISSIQPQEMLMFWRPFIKKNIKYNKFLIFINACISEENFELSALELQLLSQVYLQCQQHDIYNRFNIEKLFKFSHPYEILHQFWQYSIHNIKPIFIFYHVYQTHKFFSTQDPPTYLYDFLKKQLFILYNIIHLPEYEFTVEESFTILKCFIEEKLAQYKQLDISVVGLYRNLFIWITTNDLNSIFIQDLKSSPQKLVNLNKYLMKVMNCDCGNLYDKLCLIKISESLPINQKQRSSQQINLYKTENEEFKKLYDLASKELSKEEFEQYSTDMLIMFTSRGITSPNMDLIYQRFVKVLEKQQTQYSIDTLSIIAKVIYQKFNRGHLMTRNQRKLALTLGNYYKKQFLLQELPFHSQYVLASLFFINNKSFPDEFPIDKFISTNKFTIIQLAPIINHYNIKIKQQKMHQLLKYLSFSRFFQFYFATEKQLITKKGIDKLVQLLHFNLFHNAKPQNIAKLLQLNIKDLKKFNMEMLKYLSKKLALWYHITKTIDDHKLQDMLYVLKQIFHKQQMLTQIKRIIDKSNKKQNILIEKIQQQHQLIHTKTNIQIYGVDIQFYAYKNKKQELVLIRQKQQLIDQIRPSGQDLLLGKFIQMKLNAQVSFLGCSLQSM